MLRVPWRRVERCADPVGREPRMKLFVGICPVAPLPGACRYDLPPSRAELRPLRVGLTSPVLISPTIVRMSASTTFIYAGLTWMSVGLTCISTSTTSISDFTCGPTPRCNHYLCRYNLYLNWCTLYLQFRVWICPLVVPRSVQGTRGCR